MVHIKDTNIVRNIHHRTDYQLIALIAVLNNGWLDNIKDDEFYGGDIKSYCYSNGKYVRFVWRYTYIFVDGQRLYFRRKYIT